MSTPTTALLDGRGYVVFEAHPIDLGDRQVFAAYLHRDEPEPRFAYTIELHDGELRGCCFYELHDGDGSDTEPDWSWDGSPIVDADPAFLRWMRERDGGAR